MAGIKLNEAFRPLKPNRPNGTSVAQSEPPPAMPAPTPASAKSPRSDAPPDGKNHDQVILPSDEASEYVVDGFRMTADGLLVVGKPGRGGKGEPAEVWISAPFELIGRIRDPNGHGWSKMLAWRDEDGRSHTCSIADADLHGDPRALVSTLAAQGLRIRRGAGGDLAHYLNSAKVDRRIIIVHRTGWHGIGDRKAFVMPGSAVGPPPGETIMLSSVSASPFTAQGDLSDWKARVGSFVRGHGRLVFAVSAAFAGPLLEPAGLDGGGFNLYGASSSGKTTCAEAAASVWGQGTTTGFVKTWRATANALEATAAIHSDTVLILDELGVVDPRDAAACAYQLAAGAGKARSARDGSLRNSYTWRVMVLSTGEIRLADKLAEGRQRTMAGQAVRLIDIPADAGRGVGVLSCSGATGQAKDLIAAIKLAARTCYGTAGPEFVRLLVEEGYEEVGRLVRQQIEAFRGSIVPRGADTQVQRAAERFGLVAAAGEMAIVLGVVPWKNGEARAAAEECFAAWLDARGGSEAHEVREAINRVKAFIAAHGDSRFEPLYREPDRAIINRAGYRRGEDAERQWLIFPEIWKNEVVAGMDGKAAARVLAERGMLQRAPDGFQVVIKVEGTATRFYAVNASLLGDVEPGDR